ncbi:MAG: glycosyltransferase family 2 protein [Candidatus Binatales bacterium]
MTPEVSVIIPTWNRRAMVRESIASVLEQTGARFELIVIDDGSTDGTLDDLKRLAAGARENPIIIESIAHRGPAAARNRGVDLARAPLIAFLDSDDRWRAGKLERQLAFMREHPACAISQTQELWIRDGRRVNPGRRHLKRGGDICIDSLRVCLISPSAAMMRTELFRSKGGFDESMAACEDYDLWLRILVDHEAGLLDEEALVERRGGHPDQLSATTPALDRFRILALAKLLAHEQLSDARRDAVSAVLAEKCRIHAKGLARRSRIEDAAFFERVADRAMSSERLPPEMPGEIRHRINLTPSPSPERRGEPSAECSPFPDREGGQGVRL